MFDKHDSRIQMSLFEIIKQKEKGNRSYMQKLCDLLDLKIAVMYRKVSGDVKLSLNEYFFLCDYYNILPHSHNVVSASARISLPFQSDTEEIDRLYYFKVIRDHMINISKLKDPVMWICSFEIPLAYEYQFPEIVTFKDYMSDMTNWSWDNANPRLYSFKDCMANEEEQKVMKESLDAFMKIPTIEFWNPHQFEITFHQMTYCLHAGLIEDPNEMIALADCLADYVEYIGQLVFHAKKSYYGSDQQGASLSVFYNELAHTPNMVFVQSRNSEKVYMTFDNPNFLVSQDENMTEYVKKWLDKMMKNCTHVSRNSHRNRLIFMRQMRQKIKQKQKEIRQLVENYI